MGTTVSGGKHPINSPSARDGRQANRAMMAAMQGGIDIHDEHGVARCQLKGMNRCGRLR
jgi:hypothetical protein